MVKFHRRKQQPRWWLIRAQSTALLLAALASTFIFVGYLYAARSALLIPTSTRRAEVIPAPRPLPLRQGEDAGAATAGGLRARVRSVADPPPKMPPKPLPSPRDYYDRAIRAAQSHADWQNAVLNGNSAAASSTATTQLRFLVFWPVRTGMGNVLEAMVSSYLFAMITGRIFVMRSPAFGSEGLTDVASSLGEVADFPLDPFLESDPRVKKLHWKGEKGREIAIADIVSPCEDVASENHPLMQNRTIVLRANMYFADAFFYNPHLRRALEEQFGPRTLDGGNVGLPFKPLFRWLVRLKPSVQALVDDVKRREFGSAMVGGGSTTAAPIVGLQVRMSESYAKPEQIGTFWECAEGAAKELASDRIADTGDARIFLATDNPGVQKAARKRYGDRVFWRSDLSQFASGMKVRGGHDALAGAIADVYLLAECDAIVVTQGSSFGRMAYGAAGVRPWYVTVDNKLWNTREYKYNVCKRSGTPKPCSYRNHKLLFEPAAAACLSESDRREAFDECEIS